MTEIEKIINQFDICSDQELDNLIKVINKKIADRHTIKINKLIEDFRKAFNAINNERVDIYVNDERVDDLDQFEFEW